MPGVFSTLPANFFSPLASPNREHYAALLVLYFRLFQENARGLDRDHVLQLSAPKINAWLDAEGGTSRLLTEGEWVYAARGGDHSGAYFPVTDVPRLWSGSETAGDVAWFDENSYARGENNAAYGAHPVGGKDANGYDLYDMSGNVWEWCQDWRRGYRAIRGGSWDDNSTSCSLAHAEGESRRVIAPTSTNYNHRSYEYGNIDVSNIGFRVVLGPFSSAFYNNPQSSVTIRDGVFFSKAGDVLIAYPAEKKGQYAIPVGVTGIGDEAFYDCPLNSALRTELERRLGTAVFGMGK